MVSDYGQRLWYAYEHEYKLLYRDLYYEYAVWMLLQAVLITASAKCFSCRGVWGIIKNQISEIENQEGACAFFFL